MARPSAFSVSAVTVVFAAHTAAADPATVPAVTAAAPPVPATVDLRWSLVTTPAPGPAQAIGAYANGCLQGAVALPATGRGYEVMRRSRRRFYVHPRLAAFVERLGASVHSRKLAGLLIGDAAQPRGGPTPTGHRSHQTGLDVDIAFARPPAVGRRPLTKRERESVSVPTVVELGTGRFLPTWTPAVPRLLALAASDPDVDRIFVNPAIKRELCATSRGEPWLARIRPWWGHHDHFHVRLRCPEGDALCEMQEPPRADGADDDGCGATLAWWWSDDARATLERRATPPAAPVPMPAVCAGFVADAGHRPPSEDGVRAEPAKPQDENEPAAQPPGLR